MSDLQLKTFICETEKQNSLSTFFIIWDYFLSSIPNIQNKHL